MAELSRDFLINMQARGGEQAAREFDRVRNSIDGVSDSNKKLQESDRVTTNQIRKSILDKIRDSKTYQGINQGLNGQLDMMIDKAGQAYNTLSRLNNIKFAGLSAGVGYAVYQLNKMNSAGNQVNASLDSMSIKLNATVKQSKKLNSIPEAQKASEEYITWARKYASETPFEQTEVLTAMSNLAPVFKGDLKKIQNAVKAASVLANIDPAQGFEGATFALREAATGDVRSLAMRFELSPSQLKRHMSGTKDVGTAVLNALKENGQTLEMVEQFAGTKEGMQSNMQDATNFIAGNFNRPIFDASKRGMQFRMGQQQNLSKSGGGLDTTMSALGQLFGTGMTTAQSAYMGVMRPMNARREGYLNALAPGMINAKSHLETTGLEMEKKELESRWGSLENFEKTRLKEIQRKLREIPIQTAKAEREARVNLAKRTNAIAKMLGMDPRQSKEFTESIQKVSEKFYSMVERAKKTINSENLLKVVRGALDMSAKIYDALATGPREFWSALKSSGGLDYLKKLFTEISGALGSLAKTIFGETRKNGNTFLELFKTTSTVIAKGMVATLNLMRPVISFIKDMIVGIIKLIQFLAKIIGETTNGIMFAVNKLLQAVSWVQKVSDKIFTGIKNTRDWFEANGMGKNSEKGNLKDRALDLIDPAGAARRAAERKARKDQNNDEAAAGMSGNANRSGIVDASKAAMGAGGVLAALAGIGIVKNLSRITRAGAEAGRGAATGIWGAVRGAAGSAGALGRGAVGMAMAGGPSIRDSLSAKNLIGGRGMGANAIAVGLQMFAPGPIANIYSGLVLVRNIFDMFGMVKKWGSGLKNMTVSGGKEVAGWIGKIMKGGFNGVKDLFKVMTTSGGNALISGGNKFLAYMQSVPKTFQNIMSKGGNIFRPMMNMFQKFAGGFAKFFNGAKNVFGGMSAKAGAIFTSLSKLPIVGGLFSGIAKGLGFAISAPVSAALGTAQASYFGTRFIASRRMSTIKDEKTGELLKVSPDEMIQLKMMKMAAAGGKVSLKLLKTDKETAGITLENMMEELRNRQTKEGEDKKTNASKDNVDKPNRKVLGQRHTGGHIPESGKYELQAGEYVLPASGFKMQNYAKSGGDNGKFDIQTFATLMADSAILSASLRYVDAVLRLMGVNPRQFSDNSMPGGSAGTPVATGSSSSNPSSKSTAVSSLSGTKKEKLMQIIQAARAAGDPHPEVTGAQWALESAWGAKESGKNNLFGIKAVGNQAGTSRNTWEVVNGKRVEIKAKFRDYATLQEGVQGRVDLLKGNRYAKAGYSSAGTPQEAMQALMRGGYATDPAYADKLSSILRQAGIDPAASQAAMPTSVKAVGGGKEAASNTTINLAPITISGGMNKDKTLESYDAAVLQQRKELMANLSNAVAPH